MTLRKYFWLGAVLLVLGGLALWLLLKKEETPLTLARPHFLSPSSQSLVPTLKLKGYGSKMEESFWREKIHEFELSHKCAVLVEWVPEESRHFSDLRSSSPDKVVWDVVMMNETDLETFHAANLLTPLGLPPEISSKIVPSVLNLYKRENYYEGIPFGFATQALYFNKQLFDKKGVAYPDDHWTWEDLLAIARAMFVDRKTGRGCFGVEMPWDWKLLNTFSGQSGEVLLSDRLLMNSDPSRSTVLGVQWLIDLAQNYSVDVALSESGISHFEKGEAAMAVAGPELMNRLRQHHEFIWGVTVLPTGKIRSNTLTTQAWSVWSGATQRDLAYALVLHLAQQPLFAHTLPVFSPDPSSIGMPPDSVFYDAISTSNPFPSHPLFFYWKEKVKAHFNEIVDGSGTSASVWLDSINSDIQSHPQYPKAP